MNNIIIDSREQNRISIATEYFKKHDYTVKTEELSTGDYLFNDKVVMEFKTWSDFLISNDNKKSLTVNDNVSKQTTLI